MEFNGPVFIRTVTHNYLAEITGRDVDMLRVKNVSWVADTGSRLGEFLANGPVDMTEIETMPECYCIGLGAIIDISRWPHALPEKSQ